MTIHTDPGCTHQNGAQQRGTTVGADCSAGPDSAKGCTFEDKLADSFGKGLNAAGGGVWAAQIDASGILCANFNCCVLFSSMLADFICCGVFAVDAACGSGA